MALFGGLPNSDGLRLGSGADTSRAGVIGSSLLELVELMGIEPMTS